MKGGQVLGSPPLRPPPLGEGFRQLAESVPHMVWVAHADGRWVYVNRVLKELTGCGDEATLGVAWRRFLHPDDGAVWSHGWRAGVAGGVPFQFEHRLRDRSGGWRWFEVSVYPRDFGADWGTWWVGTSTDIHALKTLQDAQRGITRASTPLPPQGIRQVPPSANLGIAELEPETLRFLDANPAYCALVGRTLEELVERDAYAIIHPDDLVPGSSAHPADSRGAPVELRYVLPNGEPVWALVQVAPITDDDGRVRSLFAIAVDVTSQRAAMQALITSEQRFRLAASTARVMVYDIQLDRSADARTTFEAVGSSELLGIDPGQLQSLGEWHERLHPDDVLKWFGGRNALAERGGDAASEYRVRHEDGQWVHVMDRARVERHPKGDRIVGTVIDISDHKRYEAALEQADRHKNEFITMLGHELRNPLAAIRYAAQLQRALPVADGRLGRCHEVIDRQIRIMGRLLDDLLDVSRIERGKLHLERCLVDLVEVVRHLLDDHAPQMRDRGLQVEEDLPRARIWVNADRTRLSQAIGNLLTNALKFTEPPGTIWVRVHGEGSEARIEVQDTGAGIDSAFLPFVFEPFQQGNGTRGAGGLGLGLGLSLVRGIAELHEGSVAVDSEGVGRGSRFQLTLPRHMPAGPPTVDDEDEPLPRRILVVEDNIDSAEVLRDLLELSGYTVRIAADGATALRIFEQLRPDVLLCDLSLPGQLSGFDIASRVRARGAHVPLMIAITGHSGEAIRADAYASGFHLQITKPVDVDELIRLIEERCAAR